MSRRTIEIKDDEELVIGARRRDVELKPPFLICGTGGRNRNGESMNLFKVLSTLPSASVKLFATLVEQRDVGSNEVVLPGSRTLENHMPKLIASGLVRRVRRSVFLINPDAVMPPKYRAVKIAWLSLGKN